MQEPTSGLDARAAAIVMRTVRNTVDTGAYFLFNFFALSDLTMLTVLSLWDDVDLQEG